MLTAKTHYECRCEKCGKEWRTRTDAIPKACPKCHRVTWNDDGSPKIVLPPPIENQTHWEIREGHNLDGPPAIVIPVEKKVKPEKRNKDWGACPFGSDADDCTCGGDQTKRKPR